MSQGSTPVTLEELVCQLIRLFEGLRLKAYWDANGKVWTIGYGHTKDVTPRMEITREQAESLLLEDSDPLFRIVGTQRPILEAAALIDFGFNCGERALRRLLAGEITFQSYGRTSGGQLLAGLETRRDFEEILIRLSKQLAPPVEKT